MDPFPHDPHDPYESDSGDEGFAWPVGGATGAVSDARSLTEQAKALMRGDLEVSPLVTAVPPMPEARPANLNPVPGIPSTFRGGAPQLALKKRTIDPQAIAHAFVGESQEVVLPEPSGETRADDNSQHGFFSADAASLSSTEGLMNPPPPPAARPAYHTNQDSTNSLAILTTAASQSIPLQGTASETKLATSHPQESSPEVDEGKSTDDGVRAPFALRPSPEVLVAPTADSKPDFEPVLTERSAPEKEQVSDPEASKPDAATPDETASNSATKLGGTPRKRNAFNKQMKKVLVAKKERDIAESLLCDKADLLDVLPREDCFFLGEEFWIFTVPQLSTVLGVGAYASAVSEGKKAEFHELIVSKLREETELLKETISGSKEGRDSSGQVVNGAHAAEARLQAWIQKLKIGFYGKPMQERFPLDGPISCLFPKSARNFLASAKVDTLFEFLSLKKTETGAICDFLRVWRRACNLPDLSALALAKHLNGISQRIENALLATVPLDATVRRWMIDPIIVLTGAARDFLVDDQGITTAAEFIESRTKELSIKLAEWRERNNMVPLKGSGKVAMISGWKAAAREALEAEVHVGKVLHDIDIAAMVALDNPAATQKMEIKIASAGAAPDSKAVASLKAVKAPKQSRRNSNKRKLSIPTEDRQVQYALNASLFLSDALGESTTSLMEQAGITTAAEFFDLPSVKEDVLRKIVIASGKASNDHECDALLDGWSRQINEELGRMVRVSNVSDSAPVKKPRPAEKRGFGSARSRSAGDPFESLSSVTKRFLGTMDITTAEKFLTTRTTDIATAFVAFRQSEGMPELKGLGAIASVSGWKANVRKAAKDMGQDEIVIMEPDNKSSWGPHSRNIIPKPRARSLLSAPGAVALPKLDLVTHFDVLGGNPRALFAVRAGKGSEKSFQYRFELTVRRRNDSSPSKLFATYRGAVELSGGSASLDRSDGRSTILEEVEYLKVGRGDADCRAMFSSNLKGGGLIFLSPYGVRPVVDQDLRVLKSEIKGFVLEGKSKSSVIASNTEGTCNVATRRSLTGSVEHYLSIEKPIEKGQCVEVCFKRLSVSLQSGSFRTTTFHLRHLLDEAFGLLSRSDLRQMISFLEYEILGEINFAETLSLVVSNDTPDAIARFNSACGAKRRLHWVFLSLLTAIQDWRPSSANGSEAEIPASADLYFGALLFQKEEVLNLPKGVVSNLKLSMEDEVRQELLSALELDVVCGDSLRKSWCSLFASTFSRIMDCIVSNYLEGGHPSSELMLEKLSSCLDSCVSSPLTAKLADIALPRVPVELTVIHAVADDVDDAMDGPTQGMEATSSNEVPEFIACETTKDDSRIDEEESNVATKSILFLPRKDVEGERGSYQVSESWYRERQWWILMTVIAKAGRLLRADEQVTFMHPRALFQLKTQFMKKTGLSILNDPSLRSTEPLRPMANESPPAEPTSYSFFLGLVWPKLRAMGWRLEAGDTPTSVSFAAPDEKSVSMKRSNQWKQRRDVIRTRLARETNRTGVGNLTKTTKRLVISVIPHADSDEQSGEGSEGKGVSSAEALQRFLAHVQDQLGSDDALAAKVVDLIKTCFDELAPSMVETKEMDGNISQPVGGAKPLSARLSCDYLLRFLLILPSILRQSEVPLQEINDCTEVVRELVDWMTAKHAILFHRKFWPSKESYADAKQPRQTAPELFRRLEMLHEARTAAASGGSNDKGSNGDVLVMKELIRPEDKARLTDFLVLVLDQAVPCRATEHDVSKKYRRINVGYPGFMCRHCMGLHSEGRYFFSTIESLTTASTVFEKHVAKCRKVPDDIKAAVIEAKTRHVDQRKELPVGSQQAYFNKLWERLRTSQIEGAAFGTYVLEGTAAKEATESQESSAEELEFRDHRAILEHISTTAPWKSQPVIVEALHQYYSFVEYGGRVYNTSSRPEHFSAEWLLRKVGPRPKASRKKRLMPG